MGIAWCYQKKKLEQYSKIILGGNCTYCHVFMFGKNARQEITIRSQAIKGV